MPFCLHILAPYSFPRYTAPMTALQHILTLYRQRAHTEYEKGTYTATATTKVGDSVTKDLTALSYIPLHAYGYVINSKSAIDWVVERQCVKTDKASGIINDANLWATETIGNPKYPLDLLLSVITVSLKTLDIVEALPKMEV